MPLTCLLNFSILLFHSLFAFSFHYCVSSPSFPVSVCPLRREEGRGVSRGGPPEHTPLECRATVITGLHFSLCSGRLIHTHHASCTSAAVVPPPTEALTNTHERKRVHKHDAWCEERLMDMGWGTGRGEVHACFEIGVHPKRLAFYFCAFEGLNV